MSRPCLRSGRKIIENYEKLIRVPKCEQRLMVADLYYNQLPEQSKIRSVPKEQLAPAYLPVEANTHGTRTNNDAEVFNAMANAVRNQETLYRSLHALVLLCQRRRSQISCKMRPQGQPDTIGAAKNRTNTPSSRGLPLPTGAVNRTD